MAGSVVAPLPRCQEIGHAVAATLVGVGRRNLVAIAAVLLVIRHLRTLVLPFLEERAFTLAGLRSPSPPQSILRFGSRVLFTRREVELLLPPLLPLPVSAASQLDPTAIVTLLRSLGLSEELLSQVRAAFPPPPAQNPKKEQRLLQLRGQIDSAKKHVDRLELSVAHHRSQLLTCLENKDSKAAEVAQLENEYRLLTDFKLSPNATPAASAHVSPAHSVCESEGENVWIWKGHLPCLLRRQCLLRSLLLPLVLRICLIQATTS